MNVYIDGLGYSEEKNTRVAMQVIKSALMLGGIRLETLNTSAFEAATYLGLYFDEVIRQHGLNSPESIYRVFDALKQYEQKLMPKRTDDWPSKAQIKEQFEAFQQDGNAGLVRAIEENQIQGQFCVGTPMLFVLHH